MPIRYIPFDPTPIKGQAILNNFTRMLKYDGGEEVKNRLVKGLPFYETSLCEKVGSKDGEETKNLLIQGECLSTCAALKDMGKKVDLVYIDPPFASGADYAKKIFVRQKLKKDESPIDASDNEQSFEEKMYGDVWDKERYLNWMYENLRAIKEVMSENASIYVHLDWHIGHYVKVLMDEIFGESNFINEIVWCYTGPGSPEMQQFNRKHDTILWYCKNNEWIFNKDDIRVPYKDPNQRPRNAYMSVNNNDFSKEAIIEMRKKGCVPNDWWELPVIARFKIDDIHRTGYPTEKPEALLERIIKASSNEGQLVADFFGGSGTTATVANRLKRNFIHVDVGLNSIETARDRLKANGATFDILKIKDGVELFRNPVQSMQKIKEKLSLSPITDIMEEDTDFWTGYLNDSKLGFVVVYIPQLNDSANKVMDEVFIEELKMFHIAPLVQYGIKKAIIYYIDAQDIESVNKTKKTEIEVSGLEVEFLNINTLLDGAIFCDDAQFEVFEIKDDMFFNWCVRVKSFSCNHIEKKISEYNQKEEAKKGEFNSNEGKTGGVAKKIEISENGLELIEAVFLDCKNKEGEVWNSDKEIRINKKGFLVVDGVETKEGWDGTIKSKEKPLRMKIRNIAGDESVFVLWKNNNS